MSSRLPYFQSIHSNVNTRLRVNILPIDHIDVRMKSCLDLELQRPNCRRITVGMFLDKLNCVSGESNTYEWLAGAISKSMLHQFIRTYFGSFQFMRVKCGWVDLEDFE